MNTQNSPKNRRSSRTPLPEPPTYSSGFQTQIKLVEEILRPAGMLMTGMSTTGIMTLSAGASFDATYCKMVYLTPTKDGRGFKGSLLDPFGNQMLFEDRLSPFDYALCVHAVTGAAGGLHGIKSMGTFPDSTGLLLIPAHVLQSRKILTEIHIPNWYYIAAQTLHGECAVCGMKTVLGSDVTLHTCKRCQLPRYCSVTCQADDWRLGHSKMCNEILKRNGIKGHWACKYTMRTDELSVDHFPRFRMALDEGSVSSSLSSMLSHIHPPPDDETGNPRTGSPTRRAVSPHRRRSTSPPPLSRSEEAAEALLEMR
jgi:hypothetical protein